MNKKYYTTKGEHPEDAIYNAKKFITELENVQSAYFSKLVEELEINKEGEDWLFDYIYNIAEDEYDDFDCYLKSFNRKYTDFVNNNETEDTWSSPMKHMSSYEEDISVENIADWKPFQFIDDPFNTAKVTLSSVFTQDDTLLPPYPEILGSWDDWDSVNLLSHPNTDEYNLKSCCDDIYTFSDTERANFKNTKVGDTVIFKKAGDWHFFKERVKNATVLKPETAYTVTKISVASSSTGVKLKETGELEYELGWFHVLKK